MQRSEKQLLGNVERPSCVKSTRTKYSKKLKLMKYPGQMLVPEVIQAFAQISVGF